MDHHRLSGAVEPTLGLASTLVPDFERSLGFMSSLVSTLLSTCAHSLGLVLILGPSLGLMSTLVSTLVSTLGPSLGFMSTLVSTLVSALLLLRAAVPSLGVASTLVSALLLFREVTCVCKVQTNQNKAFILTGNETFCLCVWWTFGVADFVRTLLDEILDKWI